MIFVEVEIVFWSFVEVAGMVLTQIEILMWMWINIVLETVNVGEKSKLTGFC